MTRRPPTLAAAAAVVVAAVIVPSAATADPDLRNAAQVRAAAFTVHAPELTVTLTHLIDEAYPPAPVTLPADPPAQTAAAEPDWSDAELDAAFEQAAVPSSGTPPANDGVSRPAGTPNYDGLPDPATLPAPEPPDRHLPVPGRPDVPAVPGTAGTLICPVVGPVQFINDWGFPRSGGRSHRGNDLFAPTGTPLVAVADGTVVRVNPVDRYVAGGTRHLGGRTITFVTDDQIRWYYAHLHTVEPLQPGDRIVQGQLVGTVGRSGNARTTPPHLHIERHTGSGATNPFPYLSAVCR